MPASPELIAFSLAVLKTSSSWLRSWLLKPKSLILKAQKSRCFTLI